jgi:hypothetical protein
MKVTYQNNFEDMVALTEHLLSTNATYHKRRRWNLYGSPLLLLAAFSLLAYTRQERVFLVGGIVAALFSLLWAVRSYRHLPRKAMEKLQREKPQKEVLCRHTVTISPEGLTEETAESKHFHTWNALFDIAFTPDYIFVYNTPATAHIIPRRELGDREFQQVSHELRRIRNA